MVADINVDTTSIFDVSTEIGGKILQNWGTLTIYNSSNVSIIFHRISVQSQFLFVFVETEKSDTKPGRTIFAIHFSRSPHPSTITEIYPSPVERARRVSTFLRMCGTTEQ